MPLSNPAVSPSADIQYESRSSNTILGTADKGKTIDITATITQTFEADETLGDGWWVILRNAGTVATTIVTLDPAGSETIDGATTLKMYAGEVRMILCNGAGGNFNSILLDGGFVRGGFTDVVVKTSDESATSDTTLSADSELSFASVDGAMYEVEFVLIYGSPDGGGTPDLKIAAGEDTTPRGVMLIQYFNATGSIANALMSLETDATVIQMGTDVTNRIYKASGTYYAAGGTFALHWAQNTSNGNPTIMRAGSLLRYRRVL